MATLALKYRPRLLSDLVGQEGTVRALFNALTRAQTAGAIHHQAFLFAGVRGTGKTSMARILARALNCRQGPTPTPCGQCDACQASEQPDRNLDIVEIDAASRASVEDARALREQVQIRPAFCRYRVYIIDEVHMLSRQAFDALLKILEEPPAHAVFVLATTELEDVPDTIKSRVQIFPFRLIPPGLIESRLKLVCEQEGFQFEPQALRLVAEAGQGSMRDALTTLDRVIAAGEGLVREDIVREQLGIVPAIRIQNTLECLLNGDTLGLYEQCQELASQGADWITFWRELMLAYRQRMEDEARRGGATHDLLRMARMLQLLLGRERDLRDSSLPRVVVELALVTASQLPHLAPLDTLASSSTELRPPRPPISQTASSSIQLGKMPTPPPTHSTELNPPSSTSRPMSRVLPPQTQLLPPPAPTPSLREQRSIPKVPILPEEDVTRPVPIPSDQWQDTPGLRQALSENLRLDSGSGTKLFRSALDLAQTLVFDPPILRLQFTEGHEVFLEQFKGDQANPLLIKQLSSFLPGLVRLEIDRQGQTRTPEDKLRQHPKLQELLRDVGGDILEIR